LKLAANDKAAKPKPPGGWSGHAAEFFDHTWRLTKTSMARAYGDRETVAMGAVHEFCGLLRIRQSLICRVDTHFIFNALEPAQFGFHADAARVSELDNPAGRRDVLVERKV